MFMLSRGIVKLRFVGLSDVLRRFNLTTLFEVGVGVTRKKFSTVCGITSKTTEVSPDMKKNWLNKVWTVKKGAVL